MKTRKKKSFHAEVVHPETGARRREFYADSESAKTETARSRLRKSLINKAVGYKTFSEAGWQLSAHLRTEGHDKKAARLETALRAHLDRLLGDQKLRYISVKALSIASAQLQTMKLGARTIRSYLQSMCQVLRFGFGSATPPVKYPRQIPGRPKPAPWGSCGLQYRTTPIPYGREVDRRLAAAEGPLHILLLLLIRCGLRISEALGLRRCDITYAADNDVDEENGCGSWIHVETVLDVDGNRGPTKTKAGTRKLPLTADIETELLAWIGMHPGDDGMQLISDQKEKVYLYREAQAMHRAHERALAAPHFGFHRYRAGCVTTWLVAGISLSNVMTWIGHSSLRTTIGTYAGAIMLSAELWKRLFPNEDAKQGPEARIQRALTGETG